MLPQPAVVGEEDHDGVVGEFQLVEFLHHAPHRVVHVLDHRGVYGVVHAGSRLGLGLVFRDDRLAGLERDVNGVVHEVHAERAALVGLDELHALVGQRLGEVVGPGHLDLRRRAIAEVPPPAGDDHRVEALLVGEVRGPAQVPLAERPARIARPLQRFGKRNYVQRQMLRAINRYAHLLERPPVAGDEVRNAQPRRILPRDDARPRRRTHRTRRVRVSEPHPLRRQPVNVRRLVERIPITPHVRPAQIVDQHEHEVRPLRLCGRHHSGRPLRSRSTVGPLKSQADRGPQHRARGGEPHPPQDITPAHFTHRWLLELKPRSYLRKQPISSESGDLIAPGRTSVAR